MQSCKCKYLYLCNSSDHSLVDGYIVIIFPGTILSSFCSSNKGFCCSFYRIAGSLKKQDIMLREIR